MDFHVAGRGKICTALSEQGGTGMTFWTLGTGTGIDEPIPKFWEREREIAFPIFRNGNRNGNGAVRSFDTVSPEDSIKPHYLWSLKKIWKVDSKDV